MVSGGECPVDELPVQGLVKGQVGGEDHPGTAAKMSCQQRDAVFPGVLGVDDIVALLFAQVCQGFRCLQVQHVAHLHPMGRDAHGAHFVGQRTVHIVAQTAGCFVRMQMCHQIFHIPLGAGFTGKIDQVQYFHLELLERKIPAKSRMGRAFIR